MYFSFFLHGARGKVRRVLLALLLLFGARHFFLFPLFLAFVFIFFLPYILSWPHGLWPYSINSGFGRRRWVCPQETNSWIQTDLCCSGDLLLVLVGYSGLLLFSLGSLLLAAYLVTGRVRISRPASLHAKSINPKEPIMVSNYYYYTVVVFVMHIFRAPPASCACSSAGFWHSLPLSALLSLCAGIPPPWWGTCSVAGGPEMSRCRRRGRSSHEFTTKLMFFLFANMLRAVNARPGPRHVTDFFSFNFGGLFYIKFSVFLGTIVAF